jgi:hypothetical protein
VVPAPAHLDPKQQWPHWQELLDIPKPEAQRLRTTHRSDGDASSTMVRAAARDSTTLGTAIEVAQGQRVSGTREFIPWPEADRPKA